MQPMRPIEPMKPYDPASRRAHRRQARWRVWNRIVLVIGYAALAYNLIRGILYLLVLAEDWL